MSISARCRQTMVPQRDPLNVEPFLQVARHLPPKRQNSRPRLELIYSTALTKVTAMAMETSMETSVHITTEITT